MRHLLLSCATAALVVSSSSMALAETLIIEPSSTNLVPETFEFRFDATRKWLGCFQYDVLQGTGFFPSAWYHSASFTPVEGEYEIAFRPTWLERYCAAEMTTNNYVQVVWTNPDDPTEVYRGVIQVDAGGQDKVDEVACELRDATSPWNAIECERAVVDLSSAGDTYVLVNLTNLD